MKIPLSLCSIRLTFQAPVVGSARALYAYERQTEEEVSFKVGQTFSIYDDRDPGWTLVGDTVGDFGFVPSNYIDCSAAQQIQPKAAQEPVSQQISQAAPVQQTSTAYMPTSTSHSFIPDKSKPLPKMPDGLNNNRDSVSSDREAQPKPNQTPSTVQARHSWAVQEVDGRRKHKAMLSVLDGSIVFKPEKASAMASRWPIDDLIYYNQEKKHIFLEFKNPAVSLDLHATTKDTAEEIMSVLGAVKGASKANGLREVYSIANTAEQKMGKVLYDFDPQGDDEVAVKEGDVVFVVDNEQSDEWWMVRTSKGIEGVVPSTYIELMASSKNQSSKSQKQDEPSKSKPETGKVRTWTDRSGTFKVEAQFIGCVDGKIHLHKMNGVKIAVGANKMSIEDVEYVERVTGESLEDERPLVDIKNNKVRKSAARPSVSDSKPSAPVSNGAGVTSGVSSAEPAIQDHDWLGFFLECGVDTKSAQRYAINFNRDQMDESVLEEISPQVLRTLGLKEGDILRVSKKLDEKFQRKKSHAFAQSFEPVPVPQVQPAPYQPRPAPQPPFQPGQVQQPPQPAADISGFQDSAWEVKPSAQPKPVQPQSVQPPAMASSNHTGALKDLLEFKPNQPVPVPAQAPAPAPAFQSTIAQPLSANPTGTRMLQVTPTGYSSVSPAVVTVPIQFQPAGHYPLQTQLTGRSITLVSQPTGGVVSVQATGSTGFVPQYSGGMSQFQPAFGSQVSALPTYGTGFSAQSTGPVGINQTGFSTQSTGSFGIHQTGFSSQSTGSNLGSNQTGSSLFMGSQSSMTNPALANSSNSFGQTLFGASMQQPSMNSLTNQFQQTSLQPMVMQQQQPFQSQLSHPQQSFQQPQHQLGSVPSLPYQHSAQHVGSMPNLSQSLTAQSTGGFGFGGGMQHLSGNNFTQAQPMQPSVSFGGGAPALQPLQATPTGRRANLAAATPQNPFGF